MAGLLARSQECEASAQLVARSDDLPATLPEGELVPAQAISPIAHVASQPAYGVYHARDTAGSEGAAVVGRVLAIDTSHREPPDLDIWRVLTKVLGALFVLVLSLAIFADTVAVLGPLPAIAGVAGVVFLLRIVPVTNLLWFAYMTHTNRRPDDQVPVWYARVRHSQDASEVMVRLKGMFSRGNVAPDDLVSFWGSWRDGVLMARHGFNHRTQTAIVFRRARWWMWFVLMTIAVAAAVFHLHDTWASLTNMVP